MSLSSKAVTTVKVASALLVLLIFATIFLSFLNSNSQTEAPRTPSGFLYTSIAMADGSVGIRQHSFAADGSVTDVPYLGMDQSTFMQFESFPVSDGLEAFYVVAPGQYVTDTQHSNIVHISLDGQHTPLLDRDNQLVRERDLDYSAAAEQLAFSAQTVSIDPFISDSTFESVSRWGVYVVDLTSKAPTFVSHGRDPQWNPDGSSLIFMKETGLYEYVLATQEVRPVNIPEGYSLAFGENMNIDISENGVHIAVASPDNGRLLVGHVTWGPASVSSLAVYNPAVQNRGYFWPTFDSQGEFLAVQAASSLGNGQVADQEIKIIDAETLEEVRSFSIKQYDFTRAFIDEWDS